MTTDLRGVLVYLVAVTTQTTPRGSIWSGCGRLPDGGCAAHEGSLPSSSTRFPSTPEPPRYTMRVCNVAGCPTLYEGKGGRCPTHTTQADRARGTARDRGYNTPGHHAFRAAVLTRDPICVIPGCINFATVADHFPLSRKELLERGMNPNDPDHGRGLCKPHHDSETAQHQPGGWHT